jgi:hypothetical protein
MHSAFGKSLHLDNDPICLNRIYKKNIMVELIIYFSFTLTHSLFLYVSPLPSFLQLWGDIKLFYVNIHVERKLPKYG